MAAVSGAGNQAERGRGNRVARRDGRVAVAGGPTSASPSASPRTSTTTTNASDETATKNESAAMAEPIPANTASTEAGDASAAQGEAETPADTRFSAEEEQALMLESNAHKSHANSRFALGHYGEAIQTYLKALAACPNYLDYENAVLRANIAAGHLKLEEWKDAEKAATEALEGLERLGLTDEGGSNAPTGRAEDQADTGARVQEVDDTMAEQLERLEKSGHSVDEVRKLGVKALLRRAKARESLGGWAALAGAEEDYRRLSSMASSMSTLDAQTVRRARATLPPRLEKAKQEEMGEMMGKLKSLGNGLLKPFGLSTDNFQFVQDEKTGGYNVQFNQK